MLLLREKLLTCERAGILLTAGLLTPEEGFVFSFLRSEKLGTDCARGFSNSGLRRPELRLETLPDDRGADAVGVQGVDEGKFLLGKSFLF